MTTVTSITIPISDADTVDQIVRNLNGHFKNESPWGKPTRSKLAGWLIREGIRVASKKHPWFKDAIVEDKRCD